MLVDGTCTGRRNMPRRLAYSMVQWIVVLPRSSMRCRTAPTFLGSHDPRGSRTAPGSLLVWYTQADAPIYHTGAAAPRREVCWYGTGTRRWSFRGCRRTWTPACSTCPAGWLVPVLSASPAMDAPSRTPLTGQAIPDVGMLGSVGEPHEAPAVSGGGRARRCPAHFGLMHGPVASPWRERGWSGIRLHAGQGAAEPGLLRRQDRGTRSSRCG